MPDRLLIRGGLVIDPASRLEALRDVLIEDGHIAKVAAGLAKQASYKGVPVLEAGKCWVVPGLIDMHVHLREPGGEADETIASGTKAAARGGFTSVLAMPNTDPPVDNPSLVRFLQTKAASEGVVNVFFAGAVTVGQKGERLTEIAHLVSAGVKALTDDGRPVMNALVMRRALEYARLSRITVIDHCEDCHLSAGGSINESRASTMKGLRGIPAASETVMAQRDIQLAELTGARLHLAHISAAGTVEALRQAKKRGIPVTGEAAPHHFTLCDADIPDWDANFKMNPPLRGVQDKEAIVEGLSDGTIDAVATDHAPHRLGRKALGLELAPFGVIGLETSLALTLSLVRRKVLSRKAFVERMSSAPARILGLASKGGLKPGMDADLTVIDPAAAWKVELPFASKSSNSPFTGMKLIGRSKATVVGGRIAYRLGS